MSTKSSRLLHLDPLAIALEKRKLATEVASREEIPTNSLSILGSQPTGQPAGGPMGSQPTLSSQPNISSQPNVDSQERGGFSLLSSLPEQKGETRVPHRYTDHLCRLLKPDEQAVYSQLYRLSWGWGKDTCFISNPKLSERSNVPITSMKRAVTGLISKGVIFKTGHTNGFGKEQGVEYRVPSLSSQLILDRQPNMSSQPSLDTNKEIHIKETHTNIADSNSAAHVRVGSRFTLQECRKYAEHLSLTGQGITNPGGYATKINRSGEADDLIEAFLTPAEPSQNIDINQCPDCHGTGFREPGGVGKGVTKCRHERLRK